MYRTHDILSPEGATSISPTTVEMNLVFEPAKEAWRSHQKSKFQTSENQFQRSKFAQKTICLDSRTLARASTTCLFRRSGGWRELPGEDGRNRSGEGACVLRTRQLPGVDPEPGRELELGPENPTAIPAEMTSGAAITTSKSTTLLAEPLICPHLKVSSPQAANENEKSG